MSDIIQDAKQLLDAATPGPWNIDGAPHPGPYDELFIHPKDDGGVIARVQPLYADAELIAVAPELAAALAEEYWEHRHEYQAADDQQWHPLTQWAEGEPDRRPWDVTPTRIVRRRVSPPEVINELL